MALTHSQLKSLIKLLKSQGVVSYKADGLELLIDPNHKTEVKVAPKHIPGQLAADLNKGSPGFKEYSEEEILLWSTGATRNSEEAS